MSSVDTQYNALVEDIRENGTDKLDRTGVGSRSVFGRKMVFDLRDGQIPLLTTKKVFTRAAFREMLWFISGTDWIKSLLQHNIHIWDSWIDPETAIWFDDELVDARVPKVYGVQWRHWSDTHIVPAADLECYQKELGYHCICEIPNRPNWYVLHRDIDQLQKVIEALRHNPDSRRIIMSAWNVGEIDQMGLPPCHMQIQFWTRELTHQERIHELGRRAPWDHRVLSQTITTEELDSEDVPQRGLSAQLYIRSNDLPLGAPFNMSQYALFIHMVAQVANMAPEDFHYVIGDAHVYTNQWNKLNEQMAREPLEDCGVRLRLNPEVKEIDDFVYEDIELVGDYQCHSAIKFPQAAV